MDAPLLICPSCTRANPGDMRFCGYCGSSLTLSCPVCGGSVPAGMHFCGHCGAWLAGAAPSAARNDTVTSPGLEPAGTLSPLRSPVRSAPPPASALLPEERRLVTALFCDLVGFTPLSEQLNLEDIRELQADYFSAMAQQIERYGGVVEKYAGDAVLALFGAPIAHEDDAERAVLCALGMQGAIEPVATRAKDRWQVQPTIRVGVNTGEVVSGAWSASGRQEVAVTGDAVNTAARIQAMAEPGDVLVGTETMRLTRRRLRYAELPDVMLKGKSGAVSLYRAIGLRERFGERWETSEGATPLVGRDRELVQLLDAWVRVQGGEAHVVTVMGDAGVGKSRLIAELLDMVVQDATVRVVRARCLSYGQGISLWLVADLLRSLFDIGEGDSLAVTHSTLTAALAGLLVRRDETSQAEALDVFGEVLGLPAGGSLVAQAGAQIRRQALIRSLKLVLREVAERAPTVLVLEDLHWADTASREVLTEILAAVPGVRLLALAAQRPGWSAPWSAWGWTERITVQPLRGGDAARLAGAVLGGRTLSPDLEAYVGERAGGNPFFVEELLRALEESGGLVQHDGTVSLAPGAAERLPTTLTEVLLARLDRLDGQARSVAQVASVIGRTFAVRLLSAVMRREVTTLESPLSALQQAEIAFPRRGSDLEYIFKHATMREVAYNTLVQKRRHTLHLDTARAIAALYPTDEYVGIIAYHYARTTEHAHAADWLEKAGDRAAAIYANDTAIENYRDARERSELAGGEPATRARLDEKLGETLFTAGRSDEAIPALEQAVQTYREERDLEGAGRAAALLGRALSYNGRPEEGLDRVEPLVELLASTGASRSLALLQLALGYTFQALGRYEEMLAATEQAGEMAGAIGDDRLLGWTMERRGTALTLLNRTDEGRAVLVDAIPLLERVGDLDRLSFAMSNLGEAHKLLGELPEARHCTERGLEISERMGNPAYSAFGLANLAHIQLSLGQWEEAQEHVSRAGEMLASLPSTNRTAAHVLGTLGLVHVARGLWEEAEGDLQRALEMAQAGGDRQVLELIHAGWAELAVLQGNPQTAIERLEPLVGSPGGFRVTIETILAWALLEVGELSRAAELVEAAVARGRAQGEVLALVDALRVQGMVLGRQKRLEAAAEILEEGLALARSLPYPYAEARILAELGRLEEARAIFTRLGAAKEVERVEEALAERSLP